MRYQSVGTAAIGLADTALVASNAGVVTSATTVFDTNFTKPANLQEKFVDPTMPAGYVPFGIAALNKQLYVTYAMQDAAKHDEVTGTGLGYVDIFDFSGNFVSRFASGDPLDAPWGVVLAPAGFGNPGGDVLIGMFSPVGGARTWKKARMPGTASIHGHPIYLQTIAWLLTVLIFAANPRRIASPVSHCLPETAHTSSGAARLNLTSGVVQCRLGAATVIWDVRAEFLYRPADRR